MALTNDIPADTIVAQSSFGTNFGVSVFVCLIGFVHDVPPFFYIVPLIFIFGAILGYALWMKGHRRLATALGTSGLLFAGILSHSMIQTIGGPTGILLLASVITAGGLGGIIEAAVTVLLIFMVGFDIGCSCRRNYSTRRRFEKCDTSICLWKTLQKTL